MTQTNEAYKEEQEEINQQVAEISRLLKRHENEAKQKKDRQGFDLGDLQEVNENLTEIIQLLK